jgi:hypothetical protein
MGRRSRARGERASSAPSGDYADAAGNTLTLRGSLTLGARREYAQALAGEGRPAATRDDAERRALELLFERLAVRWSIAGAAPIERPRELLVRLRACSPGERAWIREKLREHCAEHFPDVRVP